VGKPKINSKKVELEEEKKVEVQVDDIREKLTRFYTALLSVFSPSNNHLIVGRNKEEQMLVSNLRSNSAKSRLIYICGHPGQGKTVVLEQVLHDHFQDSKTLIFSYNAMHF
jgi:Cdc6-like AAA superfamily ATPase